MRDDRQEAQNAKEGELTPLRGGEPSVQTALTATSVSAYRNLVVQLIPRNLEMLLDMTRQFEDLGWIRESTSSEHVELTRIYAKLDEACGRAEELLGDLHGVTAQTQLLGAMVRGSNLASDVLDLVDATEALCGGIVEKIFGAVEAVATRLRNESDEEGESEYDADQDDDSEEAASGSDLSSERAASLRRCREDASEIRLALRALVTERSEGKHRTVADLIAAWSSSGLFVTPEMKSEVPAISEGSAAIAMAAVQGAIRSVLQKLVDDPEVTTDELREFLEADEDGLSGSRCGQIVALFQKPIPLSVSAEDGGRVRYSFSLSEDCLTMGSQVVEELKLSLNQRGALFQQLGVKASIDCRTIEDQLELACCLDLPVEGESRRRVSADTRRVMRRDASQRSLIRESGGFRCSVVDKPGQQPISIELPFELISSFESRSLMSARLPDAIKLARTIGASEISIAPPQVKRAQLQEAFDAGDFALIISGKLREVAPPDGVYSIKSVQQHVRRWGTLPGLADSFQDPPSYVEPFVVIPAEFLGRRDVTREVALFGKASALSYLNVATLGKSLDDAGDLLKRCRAALERVRPAVLGESELLVSVEPVDLSISPERKIRFFVYDETNAIVALVKVGLDSKSEEIVGFPWKMMRELNLGAAHVLKDLWRSNQVSVPNFQRRLTEIGFEVSDRIADMFVGTQLRRDAPISSLEVSVMMGKTLQELVDNLVVRGDRHGRKLLVLDKWEWAHRYGKITG